MSKIIEFPTITRKDLIEALFCYKRIIRTQLKTQNSLTDAINHTGRLKRLREIQNGAFDKHRIHQLEKTITTLRQAREELSTSLAAAGQLIINLMILADDLLSFHDKCQMLNINHIAALKALNGDDTVAFERMVFSYALEYRGNDDCLPMNDLSMPLWNAIHYRFIHELKNNQVLREVSTQVLGEMLPNVRRYLTHVNPNGTKVFKQLPPKLRAVKK